MTAVSERPVVVITETGDLDPRAGAVLLDAHGFDVITLPGEGLRASVTRADLPARAADAVAAIIGLSPFHAEHLDLFPRLRVIATSSTGTDMVDEVAAAQRGIEVIGLGPVATQEVAVHALTLILAALRHLPDAVRVVAEGGWTDDFRPVPAEVGSLTLGLVGFGRIAQETARIARPLFARILAVDPVVTESAHGVELVGLDAVVAESDVVSLHVPATADTRGMFSASRLARLRPGAVLVNVARGELVDTTAVVEALDAGRLGAYATDVLAGEPPALADPLRGHPRAIVTPHVGFLSAASQSRYETGPAERIVRAFAAGS